jgi:hypothetical protein
VQLTRISQPTDMRVRHDKRVAHHGERGYTAMHHQPAVLEELFAYGVE